MSSFGLIFPGGGVQYLGMGGFYYDKFPYVRECFEEVSRILEVDLAKKCFEGSLQELSTMSISQPAIFTVNYTSYLVLKNHFKIEPTVAAGHSLGEYSALTASGVINFVDAINLVSVRGKLLERAGKKVNGRMLAVSGISQINIENRLNDLKKKGSILYCCVHNSSLQHVVCGSESDIDLLILNLENDNVNCDLLNIETASHSPFMDDIINEFSETLEDCSFKKGRFPVLSNIDSEPYENDPVLIKKRLINHLVKPVEWNSCMNTLSNQVDIIIESGPQAVLKKLSGYIVPSKKVFSMGIEEDFNALNVMSASWRPNHEGFMQRCRTIAVTEPNNNKQINEDKYLQQVIDPMKQLLSLPLNVENLIKEAAESKKLLHHVLTGKMNDSSKATCIIDKLIKEYNIENTIK